MGEKKRGSEGILGNDEGRQGNKKRTPVACANLANLGLPGQLK